jgi:spore germination protein KA
MRYSRKKLNIPIGQQEVALQPLGSQLSQNIEYLHFLLDKCSDAVFKEFSFGPQGENKGLIVFFDGLVDKKEVELHILKSMMLELDMQTQKDAWPPPDVFAVVQDSIVSIAEIKPVSTLEEVCHHLSSGDTVLLVDGYARGLVAGTRSWQGRSVQASENEVVVRGPKEAFTETLRFNTAMLRRRLKSTNFKIESYVVGRVTKTDVVLCYIDTIAPADLVAEVKKRLAKIDIDGILDSGYLEEFLQDNRYTIFPQMEYTEKPDRVCGHLLEGQVCIIVDGSPMALITPTSFPRFWNASEDYYERYIPASFFRLIRWFAFFISLLLPSLYVAAMNYHPEMVPPPLYLTIAATREGVPFPIFVETLLLEITFELLREAGIRLPRGIGPAISIVGDLIIGDAAVRAGLVSTPTVVVVAFTGIASFAVPSYNAGIAVRIARLGFLIASGFLGLFGITIALLLLAIHLCSIQSFGLPYLSPLAPFNLREMTDIVVRRPWFSMFTRPGMNRTENEVRQNDHGLPPQ